MSQSHPEHSSSQPPPPANGEREGQGTFYDNPAHLLSVYPFLTYQPTARVAEHFASHTLTYPSLTSSSDLYPQHAHDFQRIDSPQTTEEWGLRQQAEAQMRAMMPPGFHGYAGPAYSHPPVPSQSQYLPPAHPPNRPAPLPYTFLPQYIPRPAPQHPPTPDSMTGDDQPSSFGLEQLKYMESFVDQQLGPFDTKPPGTPLSDADQPALGRDMKIQRRDSSTEWPSSVTSTPHISRVLARTTIGQPSSPDPLGRPQPSPTKKQRLNRRGKPDVSPTLGVVALPKGELTLSETEARHRKPSKKREEADAHKQGRREMIGVIMPSGPRSMTGSSPARRSVGGTSEMDWEEEDDDDDEDEEIDWKDGEWTGAASQQRGRASPSPSGYGGGVSAHGSGRTGERDARSYSQKLHSLYEDVIEESDSFSASPTHNELQNSRFFSSLSRSGAPILSDETVEKIIRYVTRVQSSKRRQSVGPPGEAVEFDAEAIGRILRLLELSMREAEGVVPFSDDVKRAVSKTKAKKTRKGKKSASPDENGEEAAQPEDEEAESKPQVLTELEIEEGWARLQILKKAGLAVEACLVIMNSDGLPKQLVSEDILSLAVDMLKEQISKVLLPLVSGLAGDRMSSRFLENVVSHEAAWNDRQKKRSPLFSSPILAGIAQCTCASLPHLVALLGRSDTTFSDSLIITTVYLAIEPLFASDSFTAARKKKKVDATGGGRLMSVLRTASMGCLRTAFARYEDQRQWIIEEVLGSIARHPAQSGEHGRFRLVSGSAISMTTALLLQLVQASCDGIPARVRKLRSSAVDLDGKQKTDIAEEEGKIYADCMESTLRSARLVGGFLFQKTGSTKITKTTHDTDYKAILETFVADLLSILYRPEWPAAPLFVSVVSRIMITALEDARSGAEAAVAKGIALDHLGDIAAKIRQFHLRMPSDSTGASLDEVIAKPDIDALALVLNKHKDIERFLAVLARDDRVVHGARDMSTVVYAQELQGAIKKAGTVIEQLAQEKSMVAMESKERLQMVLQRLRSELQSVWSADDLLLSSNDPHLATAALASCVEAARGRPLQSAFDPILHALLSAMDAQVVALRSKALRAIGAVVLVDSRILGFSSVREAIDDRLHDGSPAVRDAAVELVGKYVLQNEELVSVYYPQIAERITDSGLAVRKRIVKLLRGIFANSTDHQRRVDICCKMIMLVDDQDDGVKEIAVKSLTDMLFPLAMTDSKHDAAALLVDIIGDFQESATLLDNALQAVGEECKISDREDRFAKTTESLVSRLIDVSERSEFDALSHIRAIWLLCAGQPTLIDTSRAAVLLTYLHHPPANTDEQQSNDLLLRIFRKAIPTMPRTASTFASDLSKALLPMINKPSGHFKALEETIGCFCVVVERLTRDWTGLMRVFRACETRIRAMRQDWQATGSAKQAQSPAAPVMLYITALIAEGCKLDEAAKTEDVVAAELGKVTDRSLHDHLFDIFLDFSRMPIPQAAPSFALGSLFRGYPVLLLRPEALEWTNQVFATNDQDNQARILSVIHAFLEAEIEKKTKGTTPAKKKKTMEALIGSATDLSDSGVSTAVVQRNIEHILAGARSNHGPTQSSALDVLTFTVSQGLYHPLQCMPILISLETSDEPRVRERALALHTLLHQKHSTLVNVRWAEFARDSYDYQRTLSAEVVGQRDGVALLQPWYGLVSEKRAWRTEFLRALSKTFDYDLSRKETADIGFLIYLADNLTMLEYKVQEEPMLVVQALSAVVSGCAHLASMLEDCEIEGEDDDDLNEKIVHVGKNERDKVSARALVSASLVVTLALLTKNHLLDSYGLAEDKCIKLQAGKKSALGDRTVSRRSNLPLDLSRLPWARSVATVGDFRLQQTAFLTLLHEDGRLDMAEDDCVA